MKQFPDPVKPPSSISRERTKRKKEVVRSATLGICIRLIIVACEFVGFYLFSSYALLLDALSSLVDAVTSILFVACIGYAARPPDANHPFGHGRLEPLVGLQMGLLLVVLGVYMFFQQLFQVAEEPQAAINSYAWLFPFGALILLEATYRIVMYVAKKHDSPALAADALHYRMDSLTSLVAAAALAVGLFYPSWSHLLDHLGALIIAIVMVCAGAKAAWNNLHQLLDRVPAKKYFKLVRQSAEAVEGVLGTEKIRIQQYGPDAHVDIDIEVDPVSSVEVAHKVSQEVRAEIQKSWPAVRDVTVHIEPYYPNDH